MKLPDRPHTHFLFESYLYCGIVLKQRRETFQSLRFRSCRIELTNLGVNTSQVSKRSTYFTPPKPSDSIFFILRYKEVKNGYLVLQWIWHRSNMVYHSLDLGFSFLKMCCTTMKPQTLEGIPHCSLNCKFSAIIMHKFWIVSYLILV